MALHHELSIYKTGTDLLGTAYLIQRDMLRGFKRSLGEKIVQGCTDMLELMALANSTRIRAEREGFIQQLLTLVRSITVTLRVGFNLRAIHTRLWSQAVEQIQTIGAMAGGWLKKTNRAPAA